jgi:hypothetical protein
MNTKKITILLMFFMGILTANAGGPSACVDWNGYVDSKNTSGTGYITLEPGQEEKAAQTYQYTGPGKINQVRVYGNYPYIIGGVPLQVNVYSVDGNGRPTSILKTVNFHGVQATITPTLLWHTKMCLWEQVFISVAILLWALPTFLPF